MRLTVHIMVRNEKGLLPSSEAVEDHTTRALSLQQKCVVVGPTLLAFRSRRRCLECVGTERGVNHAS